MFNVPARDNFEGYLFLLL